VKAKKKHCGVIVPMVSPFTGCGTIDERAVQRIVERLVAARVHGIFVLGTTGEAASITATEKMKLVHATVHAVAGRSQVYTGISSNCLQESVEAAKRYEQMGVHAAVAHPPCYYPPSEKDLEAYFVSLAEAIDLPLLLYNIPKTTHVSLPLALVERLSHHPNVEGIKDSGAEEPHLKELLLRMGGRENFSVLCGCGALFSVALRLGADGVVPSSGNLVPGVYQAMWTAALQGNWEEVVQQNAHSAAAGARYQQGRSLGESLAALKALMAEDGLCGPTVLPPLRTLSVQEGL
jgi:4-hydroxy-tetrahydrodipicolinate synthase